MWVHFIDLDAFKEVNDTHGHHVGDELLCKVAVRARRDFGAEDRLCRLGGDEFVLICPDLDRAAAHQLADRLRALMAEPFQIGEIELAGGPRSGSPRADRTRPPRRCSWPPTEEMYLDKRARERRRRAAAGRARVDAPASTRRPSSPEPVAGRSARTRAQTAAGWRCWPAHSG